MIKRDTIVFDNGFLYYGDDYSNILEDITSLDNLNYIYSNGIVNRVINKESITLYNEGETLVFTLNDNGNTQACKYIPSKKYISIEINNIVIPLSQISKLVLNKRYTNSGYFYILSSLILKTSIGVVGNNNIVDNIKELTFLNDTDKDVIVLNLNGEIVKLRQYDAFNKAVITDIKDLQDKLNQIIEFSKSPADANAWKGSVASLKNTTNRSKVYYD